jgi:hypothetical protein
MMPCINKIIVVATLLAKAKVPIVIDSSRRSAFVDRFSVILKVKTMYTMRFEVTGIYIFFFVFIIILYVNHKFISGSFFDFVLKVARVFQLLH